MHRLPTIFNLDKLGFGGNNSTFPFFEIMYCSSISYFNRILHSGGTGFNGSVLMEKARYTLSEYGYLNAENIIHIFACAVLITILRHLLDFVIFKVRH